MSSGKRAPTPSKKGGRGSSSAQSENAARDVGENSSSTTSGAIGSSGIERRPSYGGNFFSPKPLKDICNDELLTTAIMRDPRNQTENKGRAPAHHIIAPIPNPNPLVVNRKPLFVRPRIFIQMISNVESQTFGANLFICATDSDHNQTSSTAAFQARYENEDAHKLLNPERLPPWHVNLLNAEQCTNLYREKNLPTIRYFEKGYYKGDEMNQQIPAHFFERQQVSGIFKSEFHLESFPFDLQILKIELSLDCPIYIAQFDKLWLAANRRKTEKKDGRPRIDHQISVDQACESALQMTEWEAKPEELFYKLDKFTMVDLGSANNNSTSSQSVTAYNAYSRITIVIPISRIHTHYGFIIFLPLALIDLSSIFAFTAIAQDSLTLIATLMLAVFSLKLAFASIIPRLSYLSTMDKLFVWSYGYLFMCMVVLVFRKEAFVIEITIAFFKMFSKWKQANKVRFLSKAGIYASIYGLLLLLIAKYYKYNKVNNSEEERKIAKEREIERHRCASNLRGIFLGIFFWDYYYSCPFDSLLSILTETFEMLMQFASVNGTCCYYICLAFVYAAYMFFAYLSHGTVQNAASQTKVKAKNACKMAGPWLYEQFFNLLRLKFNPLILSFVKLWELFLLPLLLLPYVIPEGFTLASLFENMKTFLLIAVVYSFCGLFRKKFDPTQQSVRDSGDKEELDSSEIILNLDSYSKKILKNKSYSMTLRGVMDWINDFYYKIWQHHLDEIFLGSFYLSFAVHMLSKTEMSKYVCDFMTSVKLIEVVKSNHFGKVFETDKMVTMTIDGHDACEFLYLKSVFDIFCLVIILSIWHIIKDCREHQAAFKKELKEYRTSAEDNLNEIFSPYSN